MKSLTTKNKTMVNIGYQGMEGSHSEKAAKTMAAKMNFKNITYVPLISSRKVIGMLKRNEIDYGIVAIKNSTGGIVQETYDAIKTELIDLVSTELLQISHCLFVKNNKISLQEIKQIASHVQALKQCEQTIQNKFGNIELKEMEDTAISAKHLAEGKLNSDTAILCSKEAGEKHQLHLIFENFEDSSENVTEFRMFKNSINTNNKKNSLADKILYYSLTNKGIEVLSKSVMISAIFIALYSQHYLKSSYFSTASTIGGLLSAFFLFITSPSLKNKVRFGLITGYWKYYSFPQNASTKNFNQKYEIPRIVKIEEINGELSFKGWMCDNANVQLFSSQKVLISELGRRTGRLVYWYNTPTIMSREYTLNGIVTLGWEITNPISKIYNLSGWYMGKATDEIGSINYIRITKREFEAMQKNDYL